jgi:hypothetical protein
MGMKRISQSIYTNIPMVAEFTGNRLFAMAYRIK